VLRPGYAGVDAAATPGGLLAGGAAAGPVTRASGTRLAVAAGLAVLAAGLALCGLGTGVSIGAAMLICAAAAVAAILTSLRYLPGRAVSGGTPPTQDPASATPDTSTRR
jgi:hypothetical protein